MFTGLVPRNRSASAEPKGATQEARFSFYCRLLPPRKIAKLLEENKITGAGDGNRTDARNLGKELHVGDGLPASTKLPSSTLSVEFFTES
jgi:hypothetical protein